MNTGSKNKPGAIYRENIMNIGSFAPISIYASLYLYDYETQPWLVLCKMANMTTYENGEFDMKQERLMDETGICRRTAITLLQSLCKIGYLRRHKIGRSYRYYFDFNAMKIVSDVLNQNPGIGSHLRKIRDDKSVMFITNDEVKEACDKAGKEFNKCEFLNK